MSLHTCGSTSVQHAIQFEICTRMEDPPINHSSITSIKYELVHNIQGKAAFKESEFSGFCYQLPPSNIYTCTWTMLMFRKLLHIFSGDLRYQFVCKISFMKKDNKTIFTRSVIKSVITHC